MFLLQLQQRPNAGASRKHADDDLVNGARRGELRGCSGSGAPFGLDASATWFARIRECDAANGLHQWLGHPVVVYVNERGVESSAQEDASWRRAMKRAATDEITELSSARRGGASEYGAAAEGRVIFCI